MFSHVLIHLILFNTQNNKSKQWHFNLAKNTQLLWLSQNLELSVLVNFLNSYFISNLVYFHTTKTYIGNRCVGLGTGLGGKVV